MGRTLEVEAPNMDFPVFESRVIELIIKTDAKIVPVLVAYRIGCTVEVARQHLETMARQGTLTMEVDDRGLISYEMPGRLPPTNEPLSWALAAPLVAAPSVPSDATAPVAYGPAHGGHSHSPGGMPLQVQIHNAAPAVIIVGQPKSVAIAVLAALFFGPLGMLYATVGGAFVMFFVHLLAVVTTAGVGLVVTIPLGAIWAASAASNHNARLTRGYR
jgi:hypothetical protein